MIEYFVLLGSVIDLVLTYQFLSLYKIRFPQKDYTVVETNPLVRNLIRMLGLKDGMILSGIIILVVLMVILAYIPYHWKYFMLGVYYMMICFHLINFLSLRRMEVKKNGRRK